MKSRTGRDEIEDQNRSGISSRHKDLGLQGDLAAWNKPRLDLKTKFNITFYGCSSHARRPFKIHSDDDDKLCDQMLTYFLLLTKMEKRIDQRGRTKQRVLYYRKRFGEKIWEKILILAKSVKTSKTLDQCEQHFVWPPSSKLGVACNYLVNHYPALTAYLYDPRVSPDNNKVERLLRPEKLFLANSKYKGTEWGRTCLDILRTEHMTCIAAGVPYIEYLKFLSKNQRDLEKNSEKYTPYAFSKYLEAKKQHQSDLNTG